MSASEAGNTIHIERDPDSHTTTSPYGRRWHRCAVRNSRFFIALPSRSPRIFTVSKMSPCVYFRELRRESGNRHTAMVSLLFAISEGQTRATSCTLLMKMSEEGVALSDCLSRIVKEHILACCRKQIRSLRLFGWSKPFTNFTICDLHTIHDPTRECQSLQPKKEKENLFPFSFSLLRDTWRGRWKCILLHSSVK